MRRVLFETGNVGDEIDAAVRRAAGLRPGIAQAEVEKVCAEGGKLSRAEMLRCRVRYFTSGAVVGTRGFVNEVFAAKRDRFGASRREGARPMRGADFDGLCALRDLRRQVFGFGEEKASSGE